MPVCRLITNVSPFARSDSLRLCDREFYNKTGVWSRYGSDYSLLAMLLWRLTCSNSTNSFHDLFKIPVLKLLLEDQLYTLCTQKVRT